MDNNCATREMNLEEWVYQLPSFHKARQEYEKMKQASTPTPVVPEKPGKYTMTVPVEIAKCDLGTDECIMDCTSPLEIIFTGTPWVWCMSDLPKTGAIFSEVKNAE